MPDNAILDTLPMGWPVRLDNVNLCLRGRAVLVDLNATLAQRGRTVILGSNGAGKSQLLRLLHGLRQPTSGSIDWGGRSHPAECAQAHVSAAARPFHRSVLGNLLLALRLQGRRGQAARRVAEEALDICRLKDLAAQPARTLSSGETQKLFLARAWALGASTLLLDEPTANLDPASTAAIESLINRLYRHGVQIVLVTHDIAQARRLADEIVFLDQGHWREQAAAETFFKTPQTPSARAYLAGQFPS